MVRFVCGVVFVCMLFVVDCVMLYGLFFLIMCVFCWCMHCVWFVCDVLCDVICMLLLCVFLRLCFVVSCVCACRV